MSWRWVGTWFACAALALAAAPRGGDAQGSINGQGAPWREQAVCFVVRHGPDLVRLSGGLVEGLLNGAARPALVEVAGGDNFKVQVTDLAEQPPGVYAGTMIVAAGGDRCDALAKTCFEVLQRELDTRLNKSLAEELRRELEAVRSERTRAEAAAVALERQASRLAERDPGQMRELRAAEEQRQREIEVHAATEDAAAARLGKELAEARARHDEATEKRLVLGERVDQLEIEADVVASSSGKQAAMELRRRLAQERSRLEALEAELSRSSDLVSKLSDELQAAALQLAKLHSEREALAKHVEAARAQSEELRTLETEQAGLARQRARLEADTEAWLEQERSLEKRLRALRPVRVERW